MSKQLNLAKAMFKNNNMEYKYGHRNILTGLFLKKRLNETTIFKKCLTLCFIFVTNHNQGDKPCSR